VTLLRWVCCAGDISVLLAEILAQPPFNAHPLRGQQSCMQGGITCCIWAAPVLNGGCILPLRTGAAQIQQAVDAGGD